MELIYYIECKKDVKNVKYEIKNAVKSMSVEQDKGYREVLLQSLSNL